MSVLDSSEKREPPGIMEAIGGPLGMAETSLPPVAFGAAYGFTGTTGAALIAVAIGVVFAGVRLVRRETSRHALTGLVGIAFAAFVAARSGKAENFFLPGLLANAAYAVACLISVAVRYPLVGYLVGQIEGKGTAWRDDPVRYRISARASLLWGAIFALRLAVQLPLYLAGAVVALGVARTAMGLPIFALGLWLTYRLVRTPTEPAEPAVA